jgi:hypothetical protein
MQREKTRQKKLLSLKALVGVHPEFYGDFIIIHRYNLRCSIFIVHCTTNSERLD